MYANFPVIILVNLSGSSVNPTTFTPWLVVEYCVHDNLRAKFS